ncbi:MAG: lysoplasmalogenase family protein [Eubacteriales bacterium]|nr:lysoplasmalogenase family protein [Eubacteriales bacterium]
MDIAYWSDSAPLKFASILLCVFAALTNIRTADGRLVASALAFTAGADWFLLIKGEQYLLGVSLFCIVQALYFIRLSMQRGRVLRRLLPFRVLPLFILLCKPDLLIAVSLFYFTNLVLNAAEACLFQPKDRKALLFAVGLLLFIGCDVCVGAHNLGLWNAFTRVGMWLFYLPSQVLIVLSAHSKGE